MSLFGDSLFGGGGLIGSRTPEDDLQRDIANATARLRARGISTEPERPWYAPLVSGAETGLKALGAPGAIIRSLLLEAADDEAGVDFNRAFSKDRLWNKQVSGQDILSALGILREESDDSWFGRKGARFLGGLATDVVTDPFSWITGGITRPLQVLRAPVFGKPMAQLAQQGLIQPFLRGSQAGLRQTGALGAALGDEGVLAAREVAAETARQRGGNVAEVLETMLQQAPRELTRQEQLGLQFGSAVRENPLARGLVRSVSESSLTDPAYTALRNRTLRDIRQETGEQMAEVARRFEGMSPEQQRLVADLVESPEVRRQYGIGIKEWERQYFPDVQDLPDNVRQTFEFVKSTLDSYGNERLKRGLLAGMRQNYFPHKLLPDQPGLQSVLGTGLNAKQSSAYAREIEGTLAEIEAKRLAQGAASPLPVFEREAARPFAKEVQESVRSIKTFDLFEEATHQFGIPTKDLAKRLGFAESLADKLPDEVGGYKLVDFASYLVKGKKSPAYEALGKVYLPTEVADDMARIHMAYNSDEALAAWKKLWDGATNAWRPLVTTLAPSYYVNNFVGNLWNMFLGGMDNPARLKDGFNVFANRQGLIEAGTHELSYQQLRQMAQKYGVLSTGHFDNDLARQGYQIVQEGLQKPGRLAPITGAVKNAVEKGRYYLGEVVENSSRSALFTDAMVKRVAAFDGELTPQIMDKFARESSEVVSRFLFDYQNGLSHFEREYLRRLMPFYSWTRFNLPLQMAEAINQPGKFILFDKVSDNMAAVEPMPAERPPWLKEALPTPFKTRSGNPILVNPRLPLQDLSRITPEESTRGELLGMLNPLIKILGQLLTGQDWFTGRSLYEPNRTVPAPAAVRPVLAVAEALGLKGPQLNNQPGSRWSPAAQTTFDNAFGALGRLSRLPEAFDTQSMSPDEEDASRLRTARMAGLPVYTYDPKKVHEAKLYQERQRLQDLLRRVKTETGTAAPTMAQLGGQRGSPMR